MIFVTVGHLPFPRLIKSMDGLAKEAGFKVTMQIVSAKDYAPKNSEFFDFVPLGKIDKYFQQSDLIVSHCSSGPILKSKEYKKPLVILPRRKIYKEHIDDHQLDFAKAIEMNKVSGIWVVYDEADLRQVILNVLASGFKVSEKDNDKARIIATIKNFLNQTKYF
jgi:UDP-N-acetylglucosamine transferase subunit ALG13